MLQNIPVKVWTFVCALKEQKEIIKQKHSDSKRNVISCWTEKLSNLLILLLLLKSKTKKNKNKFYRDHLKHIFNFGFYNLILLMIVNNNYLYLIINLQKCEHRKWKFKTHSQRFWRTKVSLWMRCSAQRLSKSMWKLTMRRTNTLVKHLLRKSQNNRETKS